MRRLLVVLALLVFESSCQGSGAGRDTDRDRERIRIEIDNLKRHIREGKTFPEYHHHGPSLKEGYLLAKEQLLLLLRTRRLGGSVADNAAIAALSDIVCQCLSADQQHRIRELPLHVVYPQELASAAREARCGLLVDVRGVVHVSHSVRRIVNDDVELLSVTPNLESEISAVLGHASEDTCPGIGVNE